MPFESSTSAGISRRPGTKGIIPGTDYHEEMVFTSHLQYGDFGDGLFLGYIYGW